MTNAIHADEKQSREGLLFGLDRGRAACPLDCLRKRGSGFYWFRGFSGGGAAHKNIEAPRSIHNGDAQRLAFQSLATHPCFQTSNGMKKSGKMRLKQAINESTLSTAGAVPLPQWGRLRNENTAFLALSEQIHAYVEKE